MNQYISPSLLTARQAAARLGVKLETLYAYVSRGRLRSVAVPGTRERHYRPDDLEALRSSRRSANALAGPAPELPMPVIDSSICLIEDGRLYYRGRDALKLSDTATLEDVAALFWSHLDPAPQPARGERESPVQSTLTPTLSQRERENTRISLSQRERVSTENPLSPGEREEPIAKRWEGEGLSVGSALIARCQAMLAKLAAQPAGDLGLSRDTVAAAGRRILSELVSCVTAGHGSAAPTHMRLAGQWRLDARGADIVRRCLVLLADHELNASTFAARVVASTGASPYAAVSAALGALSGSRHGGAAARAEAALRALPSGGDPMAVAAERLAAGETLPGIGHPLYPEGDPRAVAILYAISAISPQARRLVHWRPNVDLALGAVSVALGLPPGAALAMFVVGRTVGWIAHAIEQYESGLPIRPRARYTGARPAENTPEQADPG